MLRKRFSESFFPISSIHSIKKWLNSKNKTPLQNGSFFYNTDTYSLFMTHELSIWTKKIIILIATLALLFVLYKIRSIVFILIISGFLTIILNPLVTFGERKKVPAWITLIIVYIIVIIL